MFQFDKTDFTKQLKQCHEKYSSSMSYDQFVGTVQDMLKNSGNNLEGELVDLLGFDSIEIVSYLLEHRQAIIKLLSVQKTNRKPPCKFDNICIKTFNNVL